MRWNRATFWARGVVFTLALAATATSVQATVNAATPVAASNKTNPGHRYSAAWQITRARFQNAQSATQTESFREHWQLVRRRSGGHMLVSPRAKIMVEVQAEQNISNAVVGPTVLHVAMTDTDFARLIGVDMPILTQVDPTPAKAPVRLVHLSLQNGEVQGKDVVLYASDDEHLAVHLDKVN